MIIGITGTLGAGKGTIVTYLQKKGFTHFSARAVLLEEIKKKQLPQDRDSMVRVANELRLTYGPSILAEKMFDMARNEDKAIIESLRTPGEVLALQKKGNFILFAVNAERKKRYNRISQRGSETDMISYEKFAKQEEIEMHNTDPNKQNITKCIEMADFTFTNNGTIDELHEKVRQVLEKLS